MSATAIQTRFRDALPPEDERARWNGFAPGRTVMPKGSRHTPDGRPLSCDVVCDRDAEVTLPDGTVIYVDIYRPVTDEEVPAILALGPYGKQGGPWNYDLFPGHAGIPVSDVSGLQKFEGPDPAFWCAHGYAVVNVDARGAYMSGGDVQMFSPQETQDNYDIIEAIAAEEWCTGRIGLSGNSWLAVTQWLVATLRPPHLAAIAPWEGFTDVYRDMICRGGIPGPDFTDQVVANNFGRNGVEDLPAMLAEQPLMSDYWRSKQADVSLIDVTAYVVASYTNTLHCRGTLEAFSRLDPEKSWLRIHNTHEWPDLYAYEADLLRFFDATLKQIDNDWADTPRVRLTVLDPGGTDVVDRPEHEWPLARAQATAFHLDTATETLTTTPPTPSSSGSYEAETGKLTFTFTTTEDLEIVGPSRLRIWVEAEGSDDIDLYAFVQKLAADGTPSCPRRCHKPASPSRPANCEPHTENSTTTRAHLWPPSTPTSANNCSHPARSSPWTSICGPPESASTPASSFNWSSPDTTSAPDTSAKPPPQPATRADTASTPAAPTIHTSSSPSSLSDNTTHNTTTSNSAGSRHVGSRRPREAGENAENRQESHHEGGSIQRVRWSGGARGRRNRRASCRAGQGADRGPRGSREPTGLEDSIWHPSRGLSPDPAGRGWIRSLRCCG